MKIGFISTRLSGTDGVSLEVNKLDKILQEMNHETFYCAGELGRVTPESYLAPRMSFNHPEIREIQQAAFSRRSEVDDSTLLKNIDQLAAGLRQEIRAFVEEFDLDALFTQNAQSLPMNIPLGVALTEFLEGNSFPTIAHHHDFWWERQRFRRSRVENILQKHFPPNLPTSRDLVINSIAKKVLHQRKGIEAKVLPNVFKFAEHPPQVDEFNKDLREHLGISKDEIFFLQPTRVVPRKGIENSIKLLSQLPHQQNKLFIAHEAGDEGMAYLQDLRDLASQLGVDLRYVADMFGQTREASPQKRYSLWDAYLHADFVTYPSQKEGFGNALLETIYFRLPALVNRYPVYVEDIALLGFEFVEMSGQITEAVVKEVRKLMKDKERQKEMVENNFRLGSKYFSYDAAKQVLAETIAMLCPGSVSEDG